ncbi:hypothetical protein FB45DRAFT_1030228 [Roridomyces roridus]|uniref:Protein kinase domain-containing protein n=1 Tax=Roridomyces roridus TaxID=1738132 RepID=A0AAD7BNW3_9AGAR|nr:hypothetical protein FB45DRAFT_1030228 [Roridomyces roridus]
MKNKNRVHHLPPVHPSNTTERRSPSFSDTSSYVLFDTPPSSPPATAYFDVNHLGVRSDKDHLFVVGAHHGFPDLRTEDDSESLKSFAAHSGKDPWRIDMRLTFLWCLAYEARYRRVAPALELWLAIIDGERERVDWGMWEDGDERWLRQMIKQRKMGGRFKTVSALLSPPDWRAAQDSLKRRISTPRAPNPLRHWKTQSRVLRIAWCAVTDGSPAVGQKYVDLVKPISAWAHFTMPFRPLDDWQDINSWLHNRADCSLSSSKVAWQWFIAALPDYNTSPTQIQEAVGCCGTCISTASLLLSDNLNAIEPARWPAVLWVAFRIQTRDSPAESRTIDALLATITEKRDRHLDLWSWDGTDEQALRPKVLTGTEGVSWMGQYPTSWHEHLRLLDPTEWTRLSELTYQASRPRIGPPEYDTAIRMGTITLWAASHSDSSADIGTILCLDEFISASKLKQPDDRDLPKYLVNSVVHTDIQCLCAQIAVTLRDQSASREFLRARNDDAQKLLDLLQDLLDYELLDDGIRPVILRALLKLSSKSGRHPRCFVLPDLRLQSSQVAAGSFGDVYKGRVHGETVSVKVMRVYQDADMQALLKEFYHEALIWRQLSHPNVLPFFGVYHLKDAKNRLGLVSPWMKNGSVVSYLKRYPTEVNRLSLVFDIALGLQHLHSWKLVHGDLKGVNVLVTRSGRAVLADFGLSSVTDSKVLLFSSSTVKTGGTMRWQAPELLRGDPNSFASDVYAFACILTGNHPFHEVSNDAAVMFRIINNERPTRSPDISNNIWDVMSKCWKAHHAERLLINDIISTLREPPIRALPTGAASDWGPWYTSKFRSSLEEHTLFLPCGQIDEWQKSDSKPVLCITFCEIQLK